MDTDPLAKGIWLAGILPVFTGETLVNEVGTPYVAGRSIAYVDLFHPEDLTQELIINCSVNSSRNLGTEYHQVRYNAVKLSTKNRITFYASSIAVGVREVDSSVGIISTELDSAADVITYMIYIANRKSQFVKVFAEENPLVATHTYKLKGII